MACRVGFGPSVEMINSTKLHPPTRPQHQLLKALLHLFRVPAVLQLRSLLFKMSCSFLERLRYRTRLLRLATGLRFRLSPYLMTQCKPCTKLYTLLCRRLRKRRQLQTRRWRIWRDMLESIGVSGRSIILAYEP